MCAKLPMVLIYIINTVVQSYVLLPFAQKHVAEDTVLSDAIIKFAVFRLPMPVEY